MHLIDMTIESRPTLSICIPAYGYEKGVRRILARLIDNPRIEILVSEDMSDRPLDLSDLSDLKNLTHRVNTTPRGAIANWNKAMSWANGDYVWLLHHDEEPVFPDGLEAMLDSMEQPDAPCVLLSRLEIRDRFWQRALRSDTVRRFFMHSPRLILLHNSLGAPSNIIVQRNILELFNENLKWFVDVEWYFRIFSNCRNFTMSKFSVCSHTYDGSITNGMRDKIAVVALREIDIVCEKHNIGIMFRLLWCGKQHVFEKIKRELGR